MINDFTKQAAIRSMARYLYSSVMTSESFETCVNEAVMLINLPEVITWAECWAIVPKPTAVDSIGE